MSASLLFLSVAVYFPLHASAQSSHSPVPLDLTRPTSCQTLNSEGSYSNPQPGIGQIAVTNRGAVVCSWSVSGAGLFHSQRIRLSFEMLSNVITPGPFGPRVTASFGLATSAPVRIDPDTSAIFPNSTKTTTTTVDCCFLPAFLALESDLWINPDALSSGDRVTKICQQQFSGFADDNIFHSYTIDLDLTSQTTTWTADGAVAIESCSSFTFVPTQLVFFARASDNGNSMIAQIKNVEILPPPMP